ncbi:hypothetical protein [Marinomonas fungiae]|uniref:hypothetical protein n=1 Tax=Marinomonas fungiae TaxID=1137284 RepID=UPI003A922976
MKKLTILFTALVITLGTVLYSAMLFLKEGEQYSKYTLSYLVLTPKELSDISDFCKDKPSFIYSSSDGPKPVITHLYCKANKNDVLSYLSNEGYNSFSADTFKKGPSTIEIEGKGEDVEVITKLEFLTW